MEDSRVKANAVVDMLKHGRKPLWRVTVKGFPPHDECRVYKIKAKADSVAAFEGIGRFVAEMEALGNGGSGSA